MRILFVALTATLCFAAASTNSSLTVRAQNLPIGMGDIAPDFTLEDQNKNKITLSDARGKSPVVLVFYRGYW